MNRLTEALVKNSGGTQIGDYKYAYDAAGNRTSANVNGTITTFSYNAANELTSSLLGSTTTNYTYDGNGNLTSGEDSASPTMRRIRRPPSTPTRITTREPTRRIGSRLIVPTTPMARWG